MTVHIPYSGPQRPYKRTIPLRARVPQPAGEITTRPGFGFAGTVSFVLQATAQPFNSVRALALLQALAATQRVLELQLLVTSDQVLCVVRCQRRHRAEVERAIRGADGTLEISESDPAVVGQSPAALQLTATLRRVGSADFLPLADVDSASQPETLARFLEACQPLGPFDSVQIAYLIRSVPESRRQKAQEALDRALRGDSLLDLLRGTHQPTFPAYFTGPEKRLSQRLAQPALEVLGTVTLRGRDLKRLQSRARSVAAVYAGYFDAGFGGLALTNWQSRPPQANPQLTWPNPATQQSLYLPVPELALLYQLPAESVTTPGVSFRRFPEVQIPRSVTTTPGLLLGHGTYRGELVPVRVPLADIAAGGNLMVVGATGGGKSVLVSHLAAQILQARWARLVSLGLIDPNNRLAEHIAGAAIPEHRLKDVIWLPLGDTEHPARLGLFARPPHVPFNEFVQNTYSLLQVVFAADLAHRRIADGLWAMTVTLTAGQGTLLDAAPLFTNREFRESFITVVTDPVTRAFWQDFGDLSPSGQREFSAPILRRISALTRNPAIRNLLAQKESLDFSALIESGKILLFGTAGRAIAADASLLNELLVCRFYLAGLARLDKPEGQSPLCVLIVDECSHLRGEALATLAREGRKMAMPIVSIFQNLGALDGRLAETLLANQGNFAGFRLGVTEARQLAPLLRPFQPDQLESLNRFECVARLHVGGVLQPAFPFRTQPPLTPDETRLSLIQAHSRERYTRPRRDVEEELSHQSEMQQPQARAGRWRPDADEE